MGADGSSSLISEKNEYVKQYVILDTANRASIVITAPVSAKVGDKCSATAYSYLSPTDPTIVARAEGQTTWKSSYETEYQTLKTAIEAL